MLDQLMLFGRTCINARDALEALSDTDRLPRITIGVETVSIGDDDYTSHPEAPSGQYVTVSVSDDGIGMDQATLKRIFEPFFTTKPNDEGIGLGLATASDIVQQHDGWIEVESQINVGSTFKVYLPVADQEMVT